MTDSFLKLSSSCSLSLSVSSILMLFLMPPITSMFHTQLRGPSPWTLMWTPAVLTNVRSEKREILQIIFFHNVRSDKRRRFSFTVILSYIPFKTILEFADFICSSLTLYNTDWTRIKQEPLEEKRT